MDGELIQGWSLDQRRRGLMESSIYRRRDMVRGFTTWMGERGLLGAVPEDIELFLDAKHIGARTRYSWLSALGCFYDWVVQTTELELNPARAIIRPKLRRTLPRPVSDAELALALNSSFSHYRVWIVLAAFAGLRCAEIAGLHRDDILWDIDRLRIVGKGGKERMVPIHAEVAKALGEWPKPRKNGPLWTRPSGGQWPADQLSREANIHLQQTLSVDVTMHQFRHWFGTRTYQGSKDLRVVQELMGHSSPTTTAIYTAFSDEDASAAVATLGSKTMFLVPQPRSKPKPEPQQMPGGHAMETRRLA